MSDLRRVRDEIDAEFGSGFAAAHSDVISAVIVAAANRDLADAIHNAGRRIRAGMLGLADALDDAVDALKAQPPLSVEEPPSDEAAHARSPLAPMANGADHVDESITPWR